MDEGDCLWALDSVFEDSIGLAVNVSLGRAEGKCGGWRGVLKLRHFQENSAKMACLIVTVWVTDDLLTGFVAAYGSFYSERWTVRIVIVRFSFSLQTRQLQRGGEPSRE